MKILKKRNMGRYSEFDRHQALYECLDKNSNLHAFIAIHNTKLGPATGGTRFKDYPDANSAVEDSLRLSKAMSYKCAISNVRFGGGKGVIIGNPDKVKTRKLLRSYAKFVDQLNGEFSTGEDVGIDSSDVKYMLNFSDQFNGRPGLAVDPSPFAALSTYYCITYTLEKILGVKLRNAKVAIKGVGKVGGELVRLLTRRGVSVLVYDIDPKKLKTLRRKKHITVSNSDVLFEKVNLISPCALSHDLTPNSVRRIKAEAVCGAANNQLSSDRVSGLMHKLGIIYIPDYLANSGGLINVIDERNPQGYDLKRVKKKIRNLTNMLEHIYYKSLSGNTSLINVANKIAKERLYVG